MSLLNIVPKPVSSAPKGVQDRRAHLEEVLGDHAVLQADVTNAQSAFETQDGILRDRYIHPTCSTEIGNEDDAEEQRRRSLRNALGQAQLKLVEFENEHNISAIKTELADILANADAREQAAARRKIVELMMSFEARVLRPGAAQWAEIQRLGDEIEDRWPGLRLTTDLPHMPPGVFMQDGLRSITVWFREVLCAAQPDLFAPDDPVRVKIEQMKANHTVVIWQPSPPTWR
jgi:hypothetical protein